MIRGALQLGLEAEGFVVELAERGDEGLFKAQTESFDAMILDVMLPGMNGYAVCRELRDAGNAVPILMLTAKDGAYDEAEGIELGADDYLTKPFEWVVLLARLRAMIRRAGNGASAPSELNADGLTLNPSTHEVSHNETHVDLTPREFSLLHYLLARKGNVVTKQELLEHVWGEPDALDENVTQVYVGYLRRKVDAGTSEKRIETVHGYGYRLAP